MGLAREREKNQQKMLFVAIVLRPERSKPTGEKSMVVAAFHNKILPQGLTAKAGVEKG
jgi:hypothetical protein